MLLVPRFEFLFQLLALIVAQRVGLLRSLEDSPARIFIPWRWLLQPALAAVVVLAVDLPLVSTSLLLEALRAVDTGAVIAAPRWKDRWQRNRELSTSCTTICDCAC